MREGGEGCITTHLEHSRTAVNNPTYRTSDHTGTRESRQPANILECMTPADVTAAAIEITRRERLLTGLSQSQKFEKLISGESVSDVVDARGYLVCCVSPSSRTGKVEVDDEGSGVISHGSIDTNASATETIATDTRQQFQTQLCSMISARSDPVMITAVELDFDLDEPETDVDITQPPLSPIAYRPFLDKIWPQPDEVQWNDHREYMNIYKEVRAKALPNYMGARIPIKSGLYTDVWRRLLVGYHNKKDGRFPGVRMAGRLHSIIPSDNN